MGKEAAWRSRVAQDPARASKAAQEAAWDSRMAQDAAPASRMAVSIPRLQNIRGGCQDLQTRGGGRLGVQNCPGWRLGSPVGKCMPLLMVRCASGTEGAEGGRVTPDPSIYGVTQSLFKCPTCPFAEKPTKEEQQMKNV